MAFGFLLPAPSRAHFLVLLFAVACVPARGASKDPPTAKVNPAKGASDDLGERGWPDDNTRDDVEKRGRADVVEDELPEGTDEAPGADSDVPKATTYECYKADAAICEIERRIHVLTNELRAAQGLAPLTFSPRVAYIAREWSITQANRRSIGHAGFPRQREQQYLQEFGVRFGAAAENVAMTNGGAADPARTLVDMWARSAGHRRNMLGRHPILGVGLAKGSNGAWYATQIFARE